MKFQETKEQSKPRFRVGERVKIVQCFSRNTSGIGGDTRVGKIGSVMEIELATRAFCPDEYVGSPSYVIFGENGNYLGRFVGAELCGECELNGIKADFTFVDDVEYGPGTFNVECKVIDRKNNNVTSPCETNKQEKTIMENIMDFAKNLTLSKEEKLLRKYNLKDACGAYTYEGKELILQKLYAENEKHLIEIAEAKEKEDNKK